MTTFPVLAAEVPAQGVPALTGEGSLFDAPPDAFGSFQVQGALGAGRFGPVFRAVDPVTDVPVVVRTFSGPFTAEQRDGLVAALEVLCETSLDHPSIARPMAFGLDGDRPYLVHARLPGLPGNEFLKKRGPQRLVDLVLAVTHAAAAIDFAAAAGVHHGVLALSDLILNLPDPNTPSAVSSADAEALSGTADATGRCSGVSGFGLLQALTAAGISYAPRAPQDDVRALAAATLELLLGAPCEVPAIRAAVLTREGADAVAVADLFEAVLGADREADSGSALEFASALQGALLIPQPSTVDVAVVAVPTVDAMADQVGSGRAVEPSIDTVPNDATPSDAVTAEAMPADASTAGAVPTFDPSAVEPSTAAPPVVVIPTLSFDTTRETAPDVPDVVLRGQAAAIEADAAGLVDMTPAHRLADIDLPIRMQEAAQEEPFHGAPLHGAPPEALPVEHGIETPSRPVFGSYDTPAAASERLGSNRWLMLAAAVVLLAGIGAYAAGLFGGSNAAPLATSAAATTTAPGAETAGADGKTFSEGIVSQPVDEPEIRPVGPEIARPGATTPSADTKPAGSATPPSIAKSAAAKPTASAAPRLASPPPVPSAVPPASARAPATTANAGMRTPPASEPEPTTGRILVHADSPGARVVIDGRPRGETPLAIRDLSFGSHVVEVDAPGRPRWRREIVLSQTVPAQSIEVTGSIANEDGGARSGTTAPGAAGAPPRPVASVGNLPGGLIVESRPAGASVFVDGMLIGQTPLSLPGIDAGTHRIRIEATGYRPWTTTVAVVAGTRARVAASLEQ